MRFLPLSLLAVLTGADGFVDMGKFGRSKLDLLRRFRPFANGTPSHDQLGDIFAVLDPERFQQSFIAWVADLTGAPADVIAIDGKTSRRSYSKKGEASPLHTLSAFAVRQRLVLGQTKVATKSNEIVATPKLVPSNAGAKPINRALPSLVAPCYHFSLSALCTVEGD